MSRVLVVDDSTFMRAMISGMLLDLGHEVVGEASNGLEAHQKYMELEPDLVTMDITMPEASGIEGIQMIRSYDEQARIIMISSMGQQAYVSEALHLGAMDFLIKPITPDRLKKAVNNVITRAASL